METKEKNLHQAHRERMREKARKFGFEHFESHELLEFALFYSIPRANTNPIAHKLLNKCDNLLGVFSCNKNELLNIEGLGEKSILYIELIGEIYKRTISQTPKVFKLKNDSDTEEYVTKLFKFEVTEKIMAICLDKNLFHLDTFEVDVERAISSSTLDTRKLTNRVLTVNAKYVILAHNHVEKNFNVSSDDIEITNKVYNLLIPYNIILVNHIIVCHNKTINFRELGLMPEFDS